MKLQKKLRMPLDEVNSGLKFNQIPNASVAIASVLARWFDAIIKARGIIPTLDGRYIFSVLRSEFERNCNMKNITTELRNAMDDYGYKLNLRGREVVITKYR